MIHLSPEQDNVTRDDIPLPQLGPENTTWQRWSAAFLIGFFCVALGLAQAINQTRHDWGQAQSFLFIPTPSQLGEQWRANRILFHCLGILVMLVPLLLSSVVIVYAFWLRSNLRHRFWLNWLGWKGYDRSIPIIKSTLLPEERPLGYSRTLSRFHEIVWNRTPFLLFVFPIAVALVVEAVIVDVIDGPRLTLVRLTPWIGLMITLTVLAHFRHCSSFDAVLCSLTCAAFALATSVGAAVAGASFCLPAWTVCVLTAVAIIESIAFFVAPHFQLLVITNQRLLVVGVPCFRWLRPRLTTLTEPRIHVAANGRLLIETTTRRMRLLFYVDESATIAQTLAATHPDWPVRLEPRKTLGQIITVSELVAFSGLLAVGVHAGNFLYRAALITWLLIPQISIMNTQPEILYKHCKFINSIEPEETIALGLSAQCAMYLEKLEEAQSLAKRVVALTRTKDPSSQTGPPENCKTGNQAWFVLHNVEWRKQAIARQRNRFQPRNIDPEAAHALALADHLISLDLRQPEHDYRRRESERLLKQAVLIDPRAQQRANELRQALQKRKPRAK